MAMESAKPRRQRKWSYSKSLHVSYKDFSVHLSKELAKQLGRRSLEARQGDTVKVMRGNENLVGKQGKVSAIMRPKRMLLVEGITGRKMTGTDRQIPLRPSNLLLVAIDEKDERRLKGKKGKKIGA
ncbi:MAG TPA: 50S ribosomal protein L24 [Candidatus Diapherotrites archaeon]|uniref:50S ribosomal protein L24 n=1 Tax=Candidatus Iainarchaeum sp. TaxID=3101447 RepID=A0A7J4J2D0_9ARCH|nr:50S ribosomal protein L24P [uncultured archaeon]HIH10217.1 50S ribosomal protein L24 [Candidatus Diapherotrites archaeon]